MKAIVDNKPPKRYRHLRSNDSKGDYFRYGPNSIQLKET